jgi:ATP-binding cassette subfamily B protein
MQTTFPHYTQLDRMDCGPTCLRMVARHYGRSYTLQTLRERSFITREGVSLLGISDAAESIGLQTQGIRITLEQLIEDVPLPCILHWNQNHFVVLYKIKQSNHLKSPIPNSKFFIVDPAGKKYIMNREEFSHCWLSSKTEGKDAGIALLLAPSPEFYDCEDDKEKRKKI